MPPRAVKASAQTETGASEPVEEPVDSPATPAPEDTTEQGGDGDLDGDSASPAADPAAKQPPVDGGSAKVPDADTVAALAAPTQTMKAAGIFGSLAKEGEKSDMNTDDDEELGEEPDRKAKAKAKRPAAPSGWKCLGDQLEINGF